MAQASRHNCISCGHSLEGRLAPHICANCGVPQPLDGDSEDFFTALGAPRRFHQDSAELEKRFYELSRALHPDRFSTACFDSKKASLDRMSLLNQAYSTLKNPDELRSYLLEREGVKAAAKVGQQIPMELAETWFDIQDLVNEDPDAARARLDEFEKELGDFSKHETEALEQLESEYDSTPSKDTLLKIGQKIHVKSYLKSLERDIGRIKARL